MKRNALAGALLTALAVSLPLSSALAVFPPPIGPPNRASAAFYGSVTGAVGDGVIALIASETKTETCGISKVIPPNSFTYSIHIYPDAQIPGCGAPGRVVGFYISPGNPTQPGKIAAETGTLPASYQPIEINLTVGVSLPLKRIGVMIADDGPSQ